MREEIKLELLVKYQKSKNIFPLCSHVLLSSEAPSKHLTASNKPSQSLTIR